MHENVTPVITPEVKREKIWIPDEMTISEIQKKYSLSRAVASRARKQSFFVRNYSKKQVIMPPVQLLYYNR